MLQRQYVLHPCLRDEELPTSNGQALDMEDLGNVFMDVLEVSCFPLASFDLFA